MITLNLFIPNNTKLHLIINTIDNNDIIPAPVISQLQHPHGRPYTGTGINWDGIDWTQRDCVIAKLLGCGQSSVHKKRKKLNQSFNKVNNK